MKKNFINIPEHFYKVSVINSILLVFRLIFQNGDKKQLISILSG